MIYLIAAIGFVVDIVFIVHDDEKHDAFSIFLKTLASLTFVIIAFYLCGLNGWSFSSKMIFWALFSDLIGDFILILRNIDTKHKDLIFILGTLCFFIGHIFLMIMLYNNARGVIGYAFIITAMIYLTACVAILKSIKAKRSLMIIGAIYLLFINYILAYSFATLLFAKTAFDDAFLFGYFLFVVSDAVLILQKFGKKNIPALQPIYRLSYFISQVLIALSIMYI